MINTNNNNNNNTNDNMNTVLLNPHQTKIFVMDCRRPVHLANIYADESIVVFSDGVQQTDDLPSDGDNLSGEDESSSSDGSEDDDDNDDDDDTANNSSMGGDEEHEFEGNNNNDDEYEYEGDRVTKQTDPNNTNNHHHHPEQESDYDGEDEGDKERRRRRRKINTNSGGAQIDDDESASLTEPIADDDNQNDDNDMEEDENKKEGYNDQNGEDEDFGKNCNNNNDNNSPPSMTPRDLHKERRVRLRHYYAEGSFYGSPAAYTTYTIATQLRFQHVGDLLWLACVGLTDAYVHSRIDVAGYSALAMQLRNICHGLYPNDDFSRVSNTIYSEQLLASSSSRGAEASHQPLTRIAFSGNGRILTESDFRFFLLRHSSLFDAMVYSDYVSTKFQLSTAKGMLKLQEMLAKMGFPLDECHQPFAFMKPSLRRQLQDRFRESAEEFGLDNFEFTSFFRITGYQSLLSASDTSYAVSALLECEASSSSSDTNALDDDQQLMESFNIAFDALNTNQTSRVSLTGLSGEGNNLSSLVNGGKLAGNSTGLGAGILLAKTLQKAIIATATGLMDRNAITRLSHFRYAYISCTSPGEHSVVVAGRDENMPHGGSSNHHKKESSHVFAKPLALTRLAHYLMDLNRENGKWTDNKARPLLLLAEKPRTQTFLVVGYEFPESSGDLVKNRFGKNFELAAQSMDGKFIFDSFESNVVEVARSDVQRFLEQLHYLMDSAIVGA